MREDFPSFSNISCLVHLYVEMLQFLMVSIFDVGERSNLGTSSPFSGLEVLDEATADEIAGADTAKIQWTLVVILNVLSIPQSAHIS